MRLYLVSDRLQECSFLYSVQFDQICRRLAGARVFWKQLLQLPLYALLTPTTSCEYTRSTESNTLKATHSVSKATNSVI